MALTITEFRARKGSDQKLALLTAYDAPAARAVEAAGIDAILVGDSLGTNVLGYDSVVQVTVRDIAHHAAAVARGATDTLLIADLPFMSYQESDRQALRNTRRLIQRGRAHAVKLEGGRAVADRVGAIVAAGVPVMGHLGLTPQAVHQLGGFHAQARDYDSARALLDDALTIQEAGAFAVVLEAIPHELGRLVTERLAIPTIGIGAGPACDGEIQVLHDVVGWNPDFLPRHSQRFGDSTKATAYIVEKYIAAIRGGEFPTDKNSFKIAKKVIARLEAE
jgi:3-methyl-2-oxobutanoate hydroxymethyltransferase